MESELCQCHIENDALQEAYKLIRSDVDYLAWLLVRYFHHDAKNILYPQCENLHESEENHEIPQPIPIQFTCMQVTFGW